MSDFHDPRDACDACDATDFDPMDESLARDFWPTLDGLLGSCPVIHSDVQGGFWAVLGYEEVWKAAHSTHFTTEYGTRLMPSPPGTPALLPMNASGELHRDLRRLIDPCFSPRAVAALAPQIRAKASTLLDRIEPGGGCEWMEEFAIPFPGRMFFEVALGADPDERDRVARYAEAIIFHPEKVRNALADFIAWAGEFAAHRRSSGARRGDVVDALLDGTVQRRALTDDEIARTLVTVVLGSMETTTVALGNMLVRLAREPELVSRLRDTPELVPTAVDELLRLEAPVPAIARTALCDSPAGQTEIPEGDRLLVYYGAANRDPRVFAAPTEFDLDRGAEVRKHVAFGIGPHRCPGAHLARLDLQIVMTEIVTRWDDIRLANPEVTYRHGVSHGPATLRIEFASRGVPR
ncbi:Cytochrome P450 [Frankia canadensis]|uniref:Cytochrome P450 n=1 Tax=Frankia canadensis TaxID=1836972 RepID=A0A2I2KI37_9ACTN|nr:cytochrome P450 [Frankia canadensis]SNQ45331.1 Cytochrome P450 [Frankia canadensis]SOU52621.1 Cytochrome P450 [Frankia canadensis]